VTLFGPVAETGSETPDFETGSELDLGTLSELKTKPGF
jgi:hypothetical protein